MAKAPVKPAPRKRDATATRAAILSSARRAFADHGYDGAGVREIAAGAGVTAMMVNRYFGSKEGLFAEVVADSMAEPVILSGDNIGAPDLAARFAKALVGITGQGKSPLDGFLILFRSSSSEMAAQIAREQIAEIHLRAATDAIAAPDAKIRAALLLSLVAGFQMMRQMIALDTLTDADDADLERLLTPVLAAILGTAAKA